jgi:hypothetical protein
MVAALPAISAGVSVVQGLSGLAAKNKAASSQREQITIQQQQQQQASLAARQRLFIQQEQNEREFIMNDLSARSANQQAEFGLQSQSLLAAFEAQRQRANVQQSLLGAEQQSLQAVDALNRQAVSNRTGASTQRQQSFKQEANQQDELVGTEQQVQKMLTDNERQLLTQQVIQEQRSSSTVKKDDAARIRMLANTLSVGLDMDRSSLESMLQGANERDITTMMENLSAGDTEFNQQRVAANLRLARQQAESQQQTLNFNDAQQQQALGAVQKYQQINAQSDALSRATTQNAQRQDYLTQQESIVNSGNLIDQSLTAQKKNTRGASLIDYVATGIGAYAAVAPLMGSSKRPQPTGAPSYVPRTLQSGGYASQIGAA